MAIGNIFKSPLLHFFVIGGLIFLVFGFINDDPLPPPRDAITLTPEKAKQLAEQFAATWNRQPTQAELDGLMQNWALEEAFVREALSLGLDRGDAVVRQRLNLKMGFLAESGAAALEADDETLQKYLEENPDRFIRTGRMAFDQILLERQDQAEDISAMLAALQNGADPSTIGKASLLPTHTPMTPGPAIDRTFGAGFHASLAQLPTGSWQGPVESGYGLHLVRITDRSDAVIPPLAEIRDRVESEWRAAKTKEMKDAFGRVLLDRYTVTLPSATEVLEK
jgi:PPIC-type PPIASE domain